MCTQLDALACCKSEHVCNELCNHTARVWPCARCGADCLTVLLLVLVLADAATAAGSINKVLLASSIVSVLWDWWERGSDYIYTGSSIGRC